jgi:hypothetical protein
MGDMGIIRKAALLASGDDALVDDIYSTVRQMKNVGAIVHLGTRFFWLWEILTTRMIR